MKIKSMMKWRVRRESRCNSIDQEDVRRSLEVLDNVLAEFDDCCDTWDTPQPNGIHYSSSVPGLTRATEQKKQFEIPINYVPENSFCQTTPIDVTTSQPLNKVQEQFKLNSPPPIPKRSPATKLSDRNSTLFEFSNEITPLDFALSDSKNDSLSTLVQVKPISGLSARSDATQLIDDVFTTSKNSRELLYCVGCGCTLKENCREISMESKDTSHISPFLQRRQMFENNIAQASLNHAGSAFSNKKIYSHSVKVRKLRDDDVGRSLNSVSPESGFGSRNPSPLYHTKELKSSPSYPDDSIASSKENSMSAYDNDTVRSDLSGNKSPSEKPALPFRKPAKESQILVKNLSELDKNSGKGASNDLKWLPTVAPKPSRYYSTLESSPAFIKKSFSIENLSSSGTQNHAANCNCKEKIRRLDIKFAEVRRLLRINRIEGLDEAPPSFKPPPPPSATAKKQSCKQELFTTGNPNTPSSLNPNAKKPRVTSMSDSNLQLLQIVSDASDSVLKIEQKTESIDGRLKDLTKSLEYQQMCKNCAKAITSLSETIEVLPKLLPTDALNRPQLGLSYSMEDDLSPGVKEIQQTSTPKSDTVSSFRSKDSSNLSTFSQSIGSLGYVSSQSDLELSSSVTESEKVPMASLKSQTLPIGLNLAPSPFYSDINHQHSEKSFNNRNVSAKDCKGEHRLSVDLELRSLSAPPLPPKKKHIRGFSKKEKKKNEDNISVKSDLSLDDEGVILKRIEILDGATDMTNSMQKKEPGEEKPKRRSVWKSILRRK